MLGSRLVALWFEKGGWVNVVDERETFADPIDMVNE